jgi:diketogulonate reductase-like aldo/keto reductase
VDKTLAIPLNTGIDIPAIGFGTWQLDEGREVKSAVNAALKTGYRLIDTAKIYGNERGVGEAIRAGDVARKDIFVTTKLWTNDMGYESALEAFSESIDKLGLEYVDLYLVHWPGHSSKRRADSWRALQEIKASGRVKSIGVSNYHIAHLEEIVQSSSELPSVNQIEFHPFMYKEQAGVLDFCKKHKIVVEAYSPLARGRQLSHPVISEIAKALAKNNAQVMLRWAIQHGTVPIPKSANPAHIRDNFNVFDFELSKSDMQRLDNIGSHRSSLPFMIRLLH